MILNLPQLKALRKKLFDARTDEAKHCAAPHTKDGKQYRLERKGHRADIERLKRQGFVVEFIDGVPHVQVPLGVHGPDHLGIDPETGELVCLLCHPHGEK